MSFNLVIVESPNKCKKIESYLGAGWKVVASFGHIRDLPEKEIGVSREDNYKPLYVVEDGRKKKQVALLRKLSKEARCVYLATDPDREGEAIAWHLLDELKLKNFKRVTFNEINKSAVLNAVNNPGKLDRQRVFSQEARRVLDRLVGYRVSGPLSNSVPGRLRLSAGRVQSPALRLLVERDRAISGFSSIDHFGVRFNFQTDMPWHADWLTSSFIVAPEEYILDESLAQQVAELREFTVVSVDDAYKTKKAPPPFTTSSLIKSASKLLKVNTEKVMEVAQKLFEGSADSQEGYITYHRTDNPNISEEAYQRISEWVDDNFDPDLLAPTRNQFKAKGDAQEAHEAIRPTNFEINELKSGDDLMDAMYDLIWDRTVASQLLPAKYKTRRVVLKAKNAINGQDVLAGVGFSVCTFEGWMGLTRQDSSALDEQTDDLASMPSVSEGQSLSADSALVLKKKTKPPRKMTELELVDLLEKMGIGRPSTYASIMGVLRKRGYMAENKQRKLEHTDTGALVVDQLVNRFRFMEYEFTRKIEEQLDLVAMGKAQYADVVREIDVALDNEIKSLPVADKDTGELTDFLCNKCQSKLLLKAGRYGDYFCCSAYPDCKATFKVYEGKPFFTSDTEDYPCECGNGFLVQRPGKFGLYWPCSNSSCKLSRPDAQGKPGAKKSKPQPTGNKPGMDCPTCHSGKLAKRTFKGKPVLGCSKFPGCRHFEWSK